MKAYFTISMILIWLGVSVAFIACQMKPKASSPAQNVTAGFKQTADAAKDIGNGVHSASTQTATTGAAIVKDGKTGMAATTQGAPKADDLLYGLFANVTADGLVVVNQGAELAGVEVKVSTLVDQIANTNAAFNDYKAAQEKMAAEDAATIKARDKQIADLKNGQRLWLEGIGIGLIAVGVAGIVASFFADSIPIIGAFLVKLGSLLLWGSVVVLGVGLILVTLAKFLDTIEWIIFSGGIAALVGVLALIVVYLAKHSWKLASLETIFNTTAVPIPAAKTA